ncbi:leucyl aminopeptidase [Candidatus Micrarchaeota archaeon]|nr:leucyl aminopeptidase [Candidatus Micrarchaeota archaeon]
MEFKIVADSFQRKCDCLAIGVFEDQEIKGYLAKIDDALEQEYSISVSKKEFSGKKGEMLSLRSLGKISARKVLLFGLGKKKELTSLVLRKSFGAAANALSKNKTVCFAVPPEASDFESIKAIVEAINAGVYVFDKYKTKDENYSITESVFIATRNIEAGEQGLKLGLIFSEAQKLTRDLDNEHPALAIPEWIASRARELKDLKVSVLDEKQIQKENLQALWAVGKGSANPPRLIVLQYDGGKKGEAPIAFVGKGICFDTGGISLKPGQAMDEMRFDKSGACAVIGLMSVLKKLGIKKNVVGVCAMADNSPSGTAYKPGDIIVTASGKTIQVLNTDAEGRLVLADALYYAQKHFKPSTMIDYATLTGACVVALGDVCSGLFDNNESLAKLVFEAGEDSGERVWRMPMYEEYHEKIKSDFADIKNLGQPMQAGATAGASFLKAFVNDDVKWAHLDIAGTAWLTSKQSHLNVGATGIGAKLGLELLERL